MYVAQAQQGRDLDNMRKQGEGGQQEHREKVGVSETRNTAAVLRTDTGCIFCCLLIPCREGESQWRRGVSLGIKAALYLFTGVLGAWIDAGYRTPVALEGPFPGQLSSVSSECGALTSTALLRTSTAPRPNVDMPLRVVIRDPRWCLSSCV